MRDEITMADECDVSKIVTTFLPNTCRLPPRICKNNLQAAVECANAVLEQEAYGIPLITGSIAEFYIEPMLPHIGDVDLMYNFNTQLAIPRGHSPPTQLPAEFHYGVKVFEIIDSHLPGYVYLELRYILKKRTDDGEYNYTETDKGFYAANHIPRSVHNKVDIHGPAVLHDYMDKRYIPIDYVGCVRCLSWPPQAADWPTRLRNYGWPDSATLDRVVSNGCDLVHVAHRQCRQHERKGILQWRLSFSRAEIVLINSWMPVQQIAYHLLRVYVKTERLTESADNSEPAIMSNYHIKTLMLWACELKPTSWWTENLNLVRICVELLQTLSIWLTGSRCPHYFVNNCNLLDNSLSDGAVASKLMSIDETYLSTWLVNNYIRQCAQLCPSYISRLFDDAGTSMKLPKAVSEIVRWRVNTSLSDMWEAVVYAEVAIPKATSTHSLTARSCVCWINELTKIDERLAVYFVGVTLLHVARKISRNGFRGRMIDILATIIQRKYSQCCSVLSEPNTSELVEFLQKSAVEHLTTYRQSVARDFGSVATIVTTDFEALYAYKRGDYQRCLQLSTRNVHTLLFAVNMTTVLTLPEFIQLFDDDVVSLAALMVIVNPECTVEDGYDTAYICQVTLSLYLVTQCQLKLRHSVTSVTSLARTLDYIKGTQRRVPREHTLDHLTLKYIKRQVELLK